METLAAILEALLFAANRPLSTKALQELLPEWERPALAEIEQALQGIAEAYQQRPIELKRVASGYRFQVRDRFAPWIGRLYEEKPPKYSRALLETLAVIAYRQPVTRGEIEDIRGVSVSSSILQTLLEREWIRIVGHKETPGRPALYRTTEKFLDYFNLAALSELPPLNALAEATPPPAPPTPSATPSPLPNHDESNENT